MGNSVRMADANEEKVDAAKANKNEIKTPFISLSRNILNCKASSKALLHDFYTNKVGMKQIELSNDKIKYGFEHQNKRDANLEFHFDENFKQIASNQNDAYW